MQIKTTDAPAYWIWYPGDFEKYHAMKQNFSRVERGCSWPAFWKSEGFRNRVAFRRKYHITKKTSFSVHGIKDSYGYVQVNDLKYPFGETIPCMPGDYSISVHIACISSMPSVYIDGDVVKSDAGWNADDFCFAPVPAAFNRYFTDKTEDPSEWHYSEKLFFPVDETEINGGVLYEFETELTAALEIRGSGTPVVYLGESRPEALDTNNCYYHCIPDSSSGMCPRQAVLFAFIPECKKGDYEVIAHHQYVDIPVVAKFRCDDEELNHIFDIASHTFSLCSGAFILDGIKRDKWIWGGDVYQSLFVNRFLTGDKELERRSLLALAGNDPVMTHVNTIIDYSLFWILSVYEHYLSYGDREFVDSMFPKMKSIMDLCMSQRDENGFIIPRKQDWLFIDWADFDRDGPLCALQILLAEAYRIMIYLSKEDSCRSLYGAEREKLLGNIEKHFWDSEKNGYIDSYTSGKRNITKHANIFAVIFGIADDKRKKTIAENILLNDSIPKITTPYFRFFELEALCELGYLDEVMKQIKSYWGGMLKLGAKTFWEQYDPEKPLEKQYEMYGDPYGKSLCHAWSSSPIYLLAKYFVGIKHLGPGGKKYEVRPEKAFFKRLDCSFPVGDRMVEIRISGNDTIVSE